MTIYQKIDGTKYDRVFVVGDLHGSYDALMEKLSNLVFNKKKDLLISVGDLIDRGKQNVECLALVSEPWFRAVKGNHDEMAIQAVKNPNFQSVQNWVYNGGSWYYDEDVNQENVENYLIEKIDQLPYIIEVELKGGRKAVICHADYPENEYRFNKDVDTFDVVWSRRRLQMKDQTEIKGANYFIFGHTVQKDVLKVANRYYIDTGKVFGGKLTILDLTDSIVEV